MPINRYFANSEDPDEMLHKVAFHDSSGSALFAKIKTIIKDRNTLFIAILRVTPLNTWVKVFRINPGIQDFEADFP